ncbi:MAG: c-type cytochrome biogenesis protein CcmI [Alphaproteobacteria bacterium]
MVLWISFAVLAAAVTWAVTRPLLRAGTTSERPADGDLAVYRDQLAEIESEKAQGLICEPEAEAARTEVARRLIKRSEEQESAGGAGTASVVRRVALYGASALPVIALGIYLAVGSPMLPGNPYEARLKAPLEQASEADLVAKVEAHLRQHPEDGRGWNVIAPVYMRQGKFQQAAEAFERAIRLLDETPERLGGFARATIMARDRIVTADAQRALERMLELDPKSIEPRVWLAIAKEQEGLLAAAETAYRKLLGEVGSQGPWREILQQRLTNITLQQGGEADLGTAPSAPEIEPGEMAKYRAMSPQERQEVINQMVDGLSARLKKDGKDLKGWMRLVRAYSVQGRASEASTALADARRNFAGDEKSLAELNALAQSLDIGS